MESTSQPTYTKVFEMLLYNGPRALFNQYPDLDLNSVGPDGNLYLENACMRDDLVMAEALIKCGATLFVSPTVRTPLMCASFGACEGRVNMVEYLINQSGGKQLLDTRDLNGTTAMYFAASSGNLGIVQTLIAYGANPTITDNDGRAASNIASLHHNFQIMDLLEYEEEIYHEKIKVIRAGEWRPSKAALYPGGYRDAMSTLCILYRLIV